MNNNKEYINDELRLYRGEDFLISKHIKIHQVTLGEICDYNEQDYFSLVYNFTATPQSLKVQLWDAGIDYTTITAYDTFCSFLCKAYPQDKTSILFGDLDFKKFNLVKKKDGSIALYQCIDGDDVIIDEYTYGIIVKYLCDVHSITQDLKIPANNSTKMILIEDARDEIERAKREPYHSRLKNLISAMVNCEGFKYNHSQVWDMNINAFMDSVKRISKIKNANLLMQSGYSGFGINLKDINNKELDWLGELE